MSAVAFFFAFVVAFAYCHGSAFACLVKGDLMCLVSFTFWAIRGYFFGNVHGFHYQLSIKKTCTLLYLFANTNKKRAESTSFEGENVL